MTQEDAARHAGRSIGTALARSGMSYDKAWVIAFQASDGFAYGLTGGYNKRWQVVTAAYRDSFRTAWDKAQKEG